MAQLLKKTPKIVSKQSGQAAVEFIISVVVVFFFLFFFLSISILMVTSEYLDYATYMAARTYKSGRDSDVAREDLTQKTFQSYFSRVEGIARRGVLQPVVIDPDDHQSYGVKVSYDIDMFYLPPPFNGVDGLSQVTLTTEAHLGRDPNADEVQQFFEDFLGKFNLNQGNIAGDMDDNGM